MGIWRAVWNGPFYIGKLERPVSVGDAIMKVLETLWRSVLICVAAFAAFVAFAFVGSWSNNRADVAARKTAEIVASYNPGVCGDHQPILVIIGNTGRRTLTYVSYEVEILDRPGLAGRNVAYVDRIGSYTSEDIAPDKELTICRRLAGDRRYWPQLRPEMIVQARITSASFRDNG